MKRRLLAAINTALISLLAAGCAHASDPPTNMQSPRLYGQTVQGQTLIGPAASFTGTGLSFGYQWLVCKTASSSCQQIKGATGNSYTLQASDVGMWLRVAVTASNSAGSVAVSSNRIGPVTAPVTEAQLTVTPVAKSCLSTDCGPFSASLAWTLPPFPNTTGYYLTSNGTQVADVPSSPYEFTGMDCGATFTLGVQAHNASAGTGPLYSTSYATPSCGGSSCSCSSLQAIAGGANYFANITSKSAWLDSHILLGGWELQPESAGDVEDLTNMGLNLMWNAGNTPGSGMVDFNVIRCPTNPNSATVCAGGIHFAANGHDANTGAETVMQDGDDEDDQNFGPGNGTWDGTGYGFNDCTPHYDGNPEDVQGCGYTASRNFYTAPNGLAEHAYAVHQGNGAGVLFYGSDTVEAPFMTWSDINSADSYWITDGTLTQPAKGGCALLPNSASACTGANPSGLTAAQASLPADYEYDVTKLEHLNSVAGTNHPIAVDVETGCPFNPPPDGNANKCTDPPEMTASAWHALIAGARGIIWFQHNFSGTCEDDQVLLDAANGNLNCTIPGGSSGDIYQDGVKCSACSSYTETQMVSSLTTFNNEVTTLTPELLSNTAVGEVSTAADVSVLAKSYNSNAQCWVFAGAGKPANPPASNQTASFTLADRYSGPVTVYGENRTVTASSGVFSDTFADQNAVHVYEIPAGC